MIPSLHAMRRFVPVRALRRATLCILGAVALPCGAGAQLRPLEPVEWRAFDGPGTAHVALGAGVLTDQRASLAGTQGTLQEIGNWLLTYRSGRIALEFSGTAVRRFTDDTVLTAAFERTDEPDGTARVDAGDVRIATVLHVLGGFERAAVLLRFGTRLPTTSDEPGLDRDRTDFFATVAARHALSRVLRAFGEAGVGINSTIVDSYPQSDVLLYVAGVEARLAPVTLSALVAGQDDLHERVIRGNEDLAEVRLGATIGDHRWLEVEMVRGIADFSPGWGVLLQAGARLW